MVNWCGVLLCSRTINDQRVLNFRSRHQFGSIEINWTTLLLWYVVWLWKMDHKKYGDKILYEERRNAACGAPPTSVTQSHSGCMPQFAIFQLHATRFSGPTTAPVVNVSPQPLVAHLSVAIIYGSRKLKCKILIVAGIRKRSFASDDTESPLKWLWLAHFRSAIESRDSRRFAIFPTNKKTDTNFLFAHHTQLYLIASICRMPNCASTIYYMTFKSAIYAFRIVFFVCYFPYGRFILISCFERK